MALQEIHHVRLAGISAAVPKRIVETRDWPTFASAEECEKYIATVGIERLRRHAGDMTCSDLCRHAAEQLMAKLQWDPASIDLLVYVSVARDYVQPATSCILHGKLGLKQACSCFDIPHGCSGWVYGMAVVAGMMQSGAFKRALILAGDAEPMGEAHPTRSDLPMFGDAGTATALEYDELAEQMVIETQTDGTGYEAIIRREGGDRKPVEASSLLYATDAYGRTHRGIDKEMDGAAVFIFGISQIPKAIKKMLADTGRRVEDIDYFCFHQANLMMNEQIRRKCAIPAEKCPYSLRDFGNNSPASIPLTMVTQIRDQLASAPDKRVVACGFGVGLSWGVISLSMQHPVILPLLEFTPH